MIEAGRRTHWTPKPGRNGAVLACACVLLSGCSAQRLALSSVSGMFVSGGSVFEQDDDPALIAEALPFGLKLMDALLKEQPRDRALLLAAGKGYLLYGYAFVGMPAEQLRFSDVQQANRLRERARSLYLRAFTYAERALALSSVTGTERVETLYWNAAILGALISASRDQPQWLARLPDAESMLQQALALDEAWGEGALHELAIRMAGARSGGFDRAVLEQHYDRALALSRGRRASLYVTYAEAVAVRDQDRESFVALLSQALRVDAAADPENRLMNVVTQQRAQWLLDNVDQFIL